tara:strand:+ start:1428 stop:1829 length:402 start_codon:yes stop_codon:yes gene_type:complete
MKKLRGYIFSRSFMGERVPQHVQNIVIRNYCVKNKFQFLLSSVEYKMENSFVMLSEVVNNLKNIDGIITYSLFQLPEDDGLRSSFFKKILKKRKTIHFAVEELEINKIEDVEKINSIWLVKKTLRNCPERIDV